MRGLDAIEKRIARLEGGEADVELPGARLTAKEMRKLLAMIDGKTRGIPSQPGQPS